MAVEEAQQRRAPTVPGFPALLWVEIVWQARRRGVQLLLAISLLPLLVGFLLRGSLHEIVQMYGLEDLVRRIWLVALGAQTIHGGGVSTLSGILPIQITSISSFAWLFSAILGASLLASDAGSGRLQLLALRPVSRRRILAAKVLAMVAMLALVYMVSAASVYASMSIALARQEAPWIIPVYGLLLAVASLPLALAAALLGLRLQRVTTAAIAAVALYVVGSMVSALPLLLGLTGLKDSPGALADAVYQVYLLNALEPLHGSFKLPARIVDLLISGPGASPSPSMLGLPIYSQLPTVGTLVLLGTVSTAVAIVALWTLLDRYFARYTL